MRPEPRPCHQARPLGTAGAASPAPRGQRGLSVHSCRPAPASACPATGAWESGLNAQMTRNNWVFSSHPGTKWENCGSQTGLILGKKGHVCSHQQWCSVWSKRCFRSPRDSGPRRLRGLEFSCLGLFILTRSPWLDLLGFIHDRLSLEVVRKHWDGCC